MNTKKYLHTIIAALPICLGSISAASESDAPDTLYKGEYSDSKMDLAMKDARKALSKFKASMTRKSAKNQAIKVAIRDGEKVEHFWIINVTEIKGGYKGTLNNEPGIVSNVKMGDEVKAVGEDISDWMYIENRKMHGNYTLRVLLPNMPEKERAMYESMLAPLP